MNEGHEVSAAWAADLRDMGAALDLSPAAATELADTLQAFFRDASVAVRSLIGITLTCRLPDGDAVLTALRPTSTPDEVAASLQIRLPLPGGPAGADCIFVLYADRPGAFAALADGLLDALGTDSGELVLDQHLEPQASSDVSAFRHAAVHDMAEGVLLGRGFSEIGAATFIEALTAASDGDADGAARQVIRSVR